MPDIKHMLQATGQQSIFEELSDSIYFNCKENCFKKQNNSCDERFQIMQSKLVLNYNLNNHNLDININNNNQNLKNNSFKMIKNSFDYIINNDDEINLKDYNDFQNENNNLIQFDDLQDIFNYCNPRNTISVHLKKGIRGFGISLCGGKIHDFNKDESFNDISLINQLIRVKRLYPAQPASECGLIDENDFILDANDKCLVGLTCIEAFNILHSLQDEVTLKILKFKYCPKELQDYLLLNEDEKSFKLNDFDTKLKDFQNTSNKKSNGFLNCDQSSLKPTSSIKVYDLTLLKKDGSLGFTICKIENEGFFVKQITKEPASLELIEPGDKILSVNNVSLEGLTLNAAIQYLRSLPDLVELKLERTVHYSKTDSKSNLNQEYNFDLSEDDAKDDDVLKKKQLRHEVKIMLNKRNKNELNNRLKRKDLKKNKDFLGEQQNPKQLNSNNLEDCKPCLDVELNGNKEVNCNLTIGNQDYNLINTKKEDNLDVFLKINELNECNNVLLRQCSVINFKKESKLNERNNNSKISNIIKWRGATLNELENESTINKSDLISKSQTDGNKTNGENEQYSILDDLVSKISKLIIKEEFNLNTLNLSKNSNLDKKINFLGACPIEETIQLNDIELQLDTNARINNNDMYKKIEDGFFFYVVLDRRWHARLGFSLSEDHFDNCFAVNTIKHGFTACIVKEIYPNSLASFTDKIKIGDKLMEVNSQQVINKPVKEVINELRKLKGKLKLLFLRKLC